MANTNAFNAKFTKGDRDPHSQAPRTTAKNFGASSSSSSSSAVLDAKYSDAMNGRLDADAAGAEAKPSKPTTEKSFLQNPKDSERADRQRAVMAAASGTGSGFKREKKFDAKHSKRKSERLL